MRCLGDEVLNYSETVKGTKCLLCPFRQFRSPGRLKAHIKRYRKEYMFLADGKTKQLAVAKHILIIAVQSRQFSHLMHLMLGYYGNLLSLLWNGMPNAVMKLCPFLESRIARFSIQF